MYAKGFKCEVWKYEVRIVIDQDGNVTRTYSALHGDQCNPEGERPISQQAFSKAKSEGKQISVKVVVHPDVELADWTTPPPEPKQEIEALGNQQQLLSNDSPRGQGNVAIHLPCGMTIDQFPPGWGITESTVFPATKVGTRFQDRQTKETYVAIEERDAFFDGQGWVRVKDEDGKTRDMHSTYLVNCDRLPPKKEETTKQPTARQLEIQRGWMANIADWTCHCPPTVDQEAIYRYLQTDKQAGNLTKHQYEDLLTLLEEGLPKGRQAYEETEASKKTIGICGQCGTCTQVTKVDGKALCSNCTQPDAHTCDFKPLTYGLKYCTRCLATGVRVGGHPRACYPCWQKIITEGLVWGGTEKGWVQPGPDVKPHYGDHPAEGGWQPVYTSYQQNYWVKFPNNPNPGLWPKPTEGYIEHVGEDAFTIKWHFEKVGGNVPGSATGP